MEPRLLLLVVFVFILNPHRLESWNLSKDEDLQLERQLKLINKPAIKTINTDYGDVYDCVDFYKQPAFDHPLLKNFTFEKSKLLRIQRRGKFSSKITGGIGLQGGGCPLGTVPIKRIRKEDLIREKLASNLIGSFSEVHPDIPRRRPERPAEIEKKYAVARTKASPDGYQGMSSYMSIYNPQCVEGQYSAARMKMINGPDSIEVGWRVDPTYTSGDSLTRFYIRTDVGQIHCFNLRCPGFVVTSTQTPIDMVATKISKLGGPIIAINFNIFRGKCFHTKDSVITDAEFPQTLEQHTLQEEDAESGLALEVGPSSDHVGFWPKNIFSVAGGLGEMASTLEWGGEVYSENGSPKPPMGSGNLPVDDTNKCAFFSNMIMHDEAGDELIPKDLEMFTDSQHFQIKDEGYTEYPAEYLVVYGGPGGSTD